MNNKKKIIKFLNTIVPKNEKLVLFSSKPDFSDNTQAVYDYMCSYPYFQGYSLIWICSKKKNASKTAVYKNSLKALWLYLRAKVIFSSHGLFAGTTVKNQIHVGLWHGMALKRIKALSNPKYDSSEREMTFTLATSYVFQDIMARCFAIPREDVKVLGLPRNDLLLHPDYSALKKLAIPTAKKIVFWLPTYKRPVSVSKEHGVMNEGNCTDLGIQFWNHTSIKELDEWLNNKNVYLVIKIHTLQKFDKSLVPRMRNIQFVTANECSDNQIDLYSLLACGEALITDYSSVYVDYLTADKPLAFVIEDMQSYGQERGFTFDNPLEYMPGKLIRTANDFLAFLTDIECENDRYKNVRAEKRKYLNIFTDDNSTKRVVEYVFGEFEE